MDSPRPPHALLFNRIALVFDAFGIAGANRSFGQTKLADSMGISPSILRRRASEARHGTAHRGMPLDQILRIAEIAVQELKPLQGEDAQVVVAWMLGLDRLIHFAIQNKLVKTRGKNAMTLGFAPVVQRLERWVHEMDPRMKDIPLPEKQKIRPPAAGYVPSLDPSPRSIFRPGMRRAQLDKKTLDQTRDKLLRKAKKA